VKPDRIDEAATIVGAQRRRFWSADEKQKIVAEALAPGASMAEVARRHDVNPNLLFTWRRKARGKQAAEGSGAVKLVPVIVTRETTPSATYTHPSDVTNDTKLTTEKKRAILASWISDARAVENAPSLRQLDSGAFVEVDAIL